ncbi:MAG: serine/threonine-protein kinase [Pirellulaceae bacterium]|nr:serine/threonine protein kinase [Planctomycetales bacterium]
MNRPSVSADTWPEMSGSTTNVVAQLHRQASWVKQKWRDEGNPNAIEFIRQNPAFREHHSLLLDLAYEEYCLLAGGGTPVALESFCNKFREYDSHFRHSLVKLLNVHDCFSRTADVPFNPLSVKWPQPGDDLLGFQIRELLGFGTFARVYLCHERAAGDRQVVVKMAYCGENEGKTLGSLNHPNIVRLNSVAIDPATKLTCLCMPFLGRNTLFHLLHYAFPNGQRPTSASAILKTARRDWQPFDCYVTDEHVEQIDYRGRYVDAILKMFCGLADALWHAHGKGIVHGDIKPSNVLLTSEGRARLLDFNLSQNRQLNLDVVGGTLPYMPPEQLRRYRDSGDQKAPHVNHRADIFSFGVALYEMLSGKLPFGGMESGETAEMACARLMKSIQQGPPDIRRYVPELDTHTVQLIRHCLAFEAADRPESMRVVADALSISCRRRHTLQRWTRIHRRSLLAAGVTTLLAAGAYGTHLALLSPVEQRWMKDGIDAYHKGNFAAAEECFTHALESGPQMWDAYFYRGLARLHDPQKYTEAGNDFQYENEHRRTVRSRIGLAHVCMLCNDMPRAYNWYASIPSDEIDPTILWNNMAYCRYHDGVISREKTIQILEHLDTAVAAGPKRWEPYHNRSLFQMNNAIPEFNSIEQGVADAERAITLEPSDWRPRYVAAMHIAKLVDKRPDLLERGMALLTEAYNNGIPDGLLQNGFLKKKFGSHPELIKLAKNPNRNIVEHNSLWEWIDPLVEYQPQ